MLFESGISASLAAPRSCLAYVGVKFRFAVFGTRGSPVAHFQSTDTLLKFICPFDLRGIDVRDGNTLDAPLCEAGQPRTVGNEGRRVALRCGV